ncbi:MAG: formylglycine-generating enzyme family protein, partial [bacterium]|nr:formylglycine-generating enzyme family protein [bacterium]
EEDLDTEEIELDEDEELEEIEEEDLDTEEIELDEDEELEEIEGEDLDTEEIELDEDEDLEEIEEEDLDTEEIELDEDEDLEEIELDEDEELESVDELDEDELDALEEFRKQRELAEHFDNTLGEREKKFNVYVTVPKGKYTIGTKKSLKASMELQQFDMPEVHIGKYPVTNSLFEIFIDQTGYVTTAEKKGFGIVYHARYKKSGKTSSWNKSAGSEDIKGACWHQPS